MMKIKSVIGFPIVLLLLGMVSSLSYIPYAVAASEKEPQVKNSKSGICHPKGSSYYKRTKTFTPYKSMEACLKSGGRKPKR